MWTADDVKKATGGKGDVSFAAQRAHIDSRTVQKGDLFVPIKGENFDGHDFIWTSFEKGAVASLADAGTKLKTEGTVVTVPDTFKALYDLAAFNRARSNAKLIAITGSVGKTSTKEMLKLALFPAGRVYATQGNLNNHIGLPLTLANMPRETDFGVFEIGMNHAGEISPLTKLLQPHIAIITTVEAVHLEFFESIEKIADAKAEIMDGLEEGGVIILNRDNSQYERLAQHAQRLGKTIVSFGEHPESDWRLLSYQAHGTHCHIEAQAGDARLGYSLGTVGRHWATVSLSVLAACFIAGANLQDSIDALASFSESEGRGKLHVVTLPEGNYLLIDDCYNASPASMNAAFSRMRELASAIQGPSRRIAVLGDMLELGKSGPELHASLADGIEQGGIDLVFACGPLMKHLYDALPGATRGGYAADSASLLPLIREAVRPGDLVLIKGSNGSKMKTVRDALKNAL